jgi:hypothetical protein
MAARRALRAASLSVLALAALVGAALAVATGLVGEVVVDETAREPVVRTALAPARAAILESSAEGCAGLVPMLPATIDSWRSVVSEFTWSVEAIAKASDSTRLAGLALLVVPKPSCLGAGEIAALEPFVREGGGLLVAGPVAANAAEARRDAPGSAWLGEMLDAERFEPLPDERPALVALAQGSPLAASVEALSLSPPRRSRVIAVAVGSGLYWSDSRLETLDPSLPPSYHSAALTSSFGKGRVAWLGFPAEPAQSGADAARVRQLLRSAATWATGRPVVSLALWPGPYRSAVLLRANVAGQPRNSAVVARTLLEAQVRGVFVVPEGPFDDLAGLQPPLASAGDLALEMRRHPDRTSQLAALGDLLQARRVLGAWPRGLLDADATPVQAARASAAAGLGFFMSEGVSGSARPVSWHATSRVGPWQRERDVVGFNRSADDDLGLSPLGVSGLDAAWLRRRLLADFEAAAALGGLHVLSFHTHGLGAPERIETLAALVRDFRARGAWIASPTELAAWWRARAGLAVLADTTAPGRLVLRLRPGSEPPPGVVAVDVHSPPATHAVVEPASADCEAAASAPSGEVRLLLRVGPEPRDYRCVVAFVP